MPAVPQSVSLNWSAWAGLAVGLIGTVGTNYVLIMTRVTAIEVRQEYVAKDFEKSEGRAVAARSEMLSAIANLRTDLLRNHSDVVQTRYEAAKPAAAEPAAPAPPAPQ